MTRPRSSLCSAVRSWTWRKSTYVCLGARARPGERAVFDCDGVLADTERDGHRVAFNETFRRLGLPIEWSEEVYGENSRSPVAKRGWRPSSPPSSPLPTGCRQTRRGGLPNWPGGTR